KEEVGAKVEEAEADNVAVIMGGARHEAKRVVAERAAEAVEETLFGAGRVEGHGEMVSEVGREWEGEREEGRGKREEGRGKRRGIPRSADSVRNDGFFCGELAKTRGLRSFAALRMTAHFFTVLLRRELTTQTEEAMRWAPDRPLFLRYATIPES
ncbi:MAG: hypothetical protein WBQ89_20530, partial [Candidatus Acidiferrum sp.]